MQKRALLLGVVALTIAVGSSAYALRARDSAIRGWAYAASIEAKLAKSGVASKLSGITPALVLRLAGVSAEEADPEVINSALRDYVYRTNIVGSSRNSGATDAERFATLGEQPQLCGGMSLSLAWALNQVGISARIITLADRAFLEGKARYNTHTTVEVFIGGKWRISDPTFNVHFNCSDGATDLSIQDAEQCLARGAKLVDVQGKTVIAGRTVSAYYMPYASFLAARAPLPRDADVEQIEWFPHPNWVTEAQARYPVTP